MLLLLVSLFWSNFRYLFREMDENFVQIFRALLSCCISLFRPEFFQKSIFSSVIFSRLWFNLVKVKKIEQEKNLYFADCSKLCYSIRQFLCTRLNFGLGQPRKKDHNTKGNTVIKILFIKNRLLDLINPKSRSLFLLSLCNHQKQ